MADCEKLREAEAKFDGCPKCCAYCHAGQRLWSVAWRGQPIKVCCTVVSFAIKHGAEVNLDDMTPR
ncbi:MAG TPA: hypothetical protein VF765_22120 [Polyangiaceae bacterium]